MRINPVSATGYRQNNQNKNVSFGKFQDEKAKTMTYRLLGVKWDDTGTAKEAYDYFKKTKFVTIKRAKDKQGKSFVYAVMNKDVTDKHKYKARFDEILKSYARFKERKLARPAKEAGLYKKEPYMLTPLHSSTHAHNLYEDLWQAEENYVPNWNPEPKKDDEPEEYDYWHSPDSFPLGW